MCLTNSYIQVEIKNIRRLFLRLVVVYWYLSAKAIMYMAYL